MAGALVAEYVDIKGLSAEYVSAAGRDKLLDEAVKFMHFALLRDLRPPWLEQAFPKALPGDEVLSTSARPSSSPERRRASQRPSRWRKPQFARLPPALTTTGHRISYSSPYAGAVAAGGLPLTASDRLHRCRR